MSGLRGLDNGQALAMVQGGLVPEEGVRKGLERISNTFLNSPPQYTHCFCLRCIVLTEMTFLILPLGTVSPQVV